MKEYLEILKASLLNPQDLVWMIKGSSGVNLLYFDIFLVFLLGGFALISSVISYGFRLPSLLFFPLAFLLWFICGGIAHVWCFNSKGTATWRETYISTPLALFFPTILTIILFTSSRFLVVPRLNSGEISGWTRALDLIFSFLGPIYGWFFYYRVLSLLHSIKARHAMGSSLVAIFISGIALYFLGSLIP
ncbi:MAG: hypothetical protein NUV68_04085 [Caldiserica bacterium]|nr:hypothetical protein [Caldisericota bacterium]MDH7562278.1 hypothetical protein [Caldisericota bacterium]